jgi:hypothetical protein
LCLRWCGLAWFNSTRLPLPVCRNPSQAACSSSLLLQLFCFVTEKASLGVSPKHVT